jgi:hypothetical protein
MPSQYAQLGEIARWRLAKQSVPARNGAVKNDARCIDQPPYDDLSARNMIGSVWQHIPKKKPVVGLTPTVALSITAVAVAGTLPGAAS